jgi:hypothetical protein
MLGEETRDRLCGWSQQGARAVPEHLSDLIVKGQLEHVIVGHGISLLHWRSGGVKHPQDVAPFRFAPSPTFSDCSGNLTGTTSSREKEQRKAKETKLIKNKLNGAFLGILYDSAHIL